jgi:hypothetical protein
MTSGAARNVPGQSTTRPSIVGRPALRSNGSITAHHGALRSSSTPNSVASSSCVACGRFASHSALVIVPYVSQSSRSPGAGGKAAGCVRGGTESTSCSFPGWTSSMSSVCQARPFSAIVIAPRSIAIAVPSENVFTMSAARRGVSLSPATNTCSAYGCSHPGTQSLVAAVDTSTTSP